MIIIFNGDTLQLKDSLKRFSGATEKVTLDYLLENFRIPSKKELEDAIKAGKIKAGSLV